MSMYDMVVFEKKPPEIPDSREWQTKEFDCLMENYFVTEDGFLQREKVDLESVP